MRVVLSLLVLKMSSIVSAGEVLEHVTVHHSEEEFAGWPANEGMWNWGDEILVSFNLAAFQERGDKHSFTGRQRVGFARSMDGGRTWAAENHDNVVVPALVKNAAESPGGLDFSHPDFAMKVRGRYFYVSRDRGRDWRGPFQLPDFGQRTDARTSYLVTGKSS